MEYHEWRGRSADDNDHQHRDHVDQQWYLVARSPPVCFYDFMGDVYYYKSVGWVTPLATTCKEKNISGNSLWVEKLAQRKQPPFDFSEVLNLDLSAPPKK